MGPCENYHWMLSMKESIFMGLLINLFSDSAIFSKIMALNVFNLVYLVGRIRNLYKILEIKQL